MAWLGPTAVIFASWVCVLCRGEYVPCYDINLTDTSESTLISTTTYGPLMQPGQFLYHCWDVKAPDGRQIEAACDYNLTRHQLTFLLRHYVNGLLVNFGYIFPHQFLPRVFYSPSNTLYMMFAAERYDEENTVSCNLTNVPDRTVSMCDQTNITIDGPTLFIRHLPNNRVLECRWHFTSPVETYIYMDIVQLTLWISHQLTVQTVFDESFNSTRTEWTVIDSQQSNGTTFFFGRNYVVMIFSSSLISYYGAAELNFVLRSETIKGQCNREQVGCPVDAKCIPVSSLCDRVADCSDHWDEEDCETCGAQDKVFQGGESFFITGGYLYAPDGRFETNPDNSSTIPTNLTSIPVFSPESVSRQSECIWKMQGPAWCRLRIRVVELTGYSFVLKIGSGTDPALGLPDVSLRRSVAPPHPVETFSVTSSAWITLEADVWNPNIYRLSIEVTAFNLTVCDDGIPCPSGLQCLGNTSSICDGRLECAAFEDEVNCGCGQGYFTCGTGGCIPKHQLCDGELNCVYDFTDEFSCGLCGNKTIRIHSGDAPYPLVQTDWGTACLWVITADPGSKLQLELRELPLCTVAIGDGEFWGWWMKYQLNGQSGVKSSPRFFTSSGSSLWVAKVSCLDVALNHAQNPLEPLFDIDVTRFDIRQFRENACALGEVSCTSGPRCLPESSVCNGWGDCPEKEDEYGCGNCTAEQFQCRSGGKCLNKPLICNGVNDCSDSSDEINCLPCSDSRVEITGNETRWISTPRWPLPYTRLTQCQWLVVAEVGYRVVVTFLDFDLERGYDFLHIGNGHTFDDPYIKLSGVQFPISTASKSNELFLIFKTDIRVQKKGFKIQLEQKLKAGCGVGEVSCAMPDLICVQNDTSDRGLQVCYPELCGERFIYLQDAPYDLKSTWYPQSYPSNLDCHWSVFSTKDSTVLVQVIAFLTETSRDVLHISDVGNGSATSLALHGPTKVRSVLFNADELSISFTTDSTVEYSGFHLQLTNGLNIFNQSFCDEQDHFNCSNDVCVLKSALCDGFVDCHGEDTDERFCESVVCPTAYHCSNSTQCVLLSSVCDGQADCPDGDDEMECEKYCPDGCSCHYDKHGQLRVDCDSGWDEQTLSGVVKRTDTLILSGANVSALGVGFFKGFEYLNALSLSGNEIHQFLPRTFVGLGNLSFLNISKNQIVSLRPDAFYELQNVETLIATDIPIKLIEPQAFRGLHKLQTLLLVRGSPSSSAVIVKDDALTDLMSLNKLYVDDYRLCCEFASSLPHFLLPQCQTTEIQPPLNLCGSLMQNTLLRVSMWGLGFGALIGNAVVILWRTKPQKRAEGRTMNLQTEKLSHSVLVLNLAISDFFMGAYMLIIAGADLMFGEGYSSVAVQWRASTMCKLAGILAVLSSEASVFMVTLISVDCFLSIVFPFSSWKLERTSTNVAVSLVWLVSLSLSIGPTVFGSGSDSDIYGLSDVCIGLPLLTVPTDFEISVGTIDNPFGNQTISIPKGKGSKPAWIFSVVLFLGVNLACFLVVIVCYMAIFLKVRSTSKLVRVAAHRDRQIRMAIKMALIVGTDFACWMPVIIVGILSQTGTVEIGPDIYSWFVVFILPINSSLNPYLYTVFTTISARRAKRPNSRTTDKTNLKSLTTVSSNVSQKDSIQRNG